VGFVEYLTVVRRYWIVVAASMVGAIVIALLTGSVTPPPPPAPTYEAAAYLLSNTAPTQASQGLADPAAVAGLARIAPIPGRVADAIGFEGDPQKLVSKISVVPDDQTGFVIITAISTRPKEAEQLATAFVDELLNRLVELKSQDFDRRAEEIEIQIAGLEQDLEGVEGTEAVPIQSEIARLRSELRSLSIEPDPGFTVVTEPTARLVSADGFQAPRSSVGRLLIAFTIGLIFGVVLALVVGQLDTRIYTKESAEESYGAPVLIEIPEIPRRDRKSIVTDVKPDSMPAHAFQLLAAEVVRSAPMNGSRRTPGEALTVLVTSAGPSEGKSMVVANVAVALADIGKRVIVLSCDFRRPTVDSLFGVPTEGGLIDAIRFGNGEPVLTGVLQKTAVDGVSIAPSRPYADSPGRLLKSKAMARVMQEARGQADVVLVDTPPILVASDAMLLLPEVDGVLVVARTGKTTVTYAERMMELLSRAGAPVMGVILNRVARIASPRGYERYHRSGNSSEGFPALVRPSQED
jgi:capsular exopolysaccharide synthesis family protein